LETVARLQSMLLGGHLLLAAELKTGTDNQPVGAYKKLAKKSDFDKNSASLIGADGTAENTNLGEIKNFDKSLQMAMLGQKKTLKRQKEPQK